MADNAVYEIHEASKADVQFRRLMQSLKQWINSYINQDMLVVRDLFELTVGTALATLLEKITGQEVVEKGSLVAVTLKNYQLIMGLVVQFVDRHFGMSQVEGRWTLKGVLAQDISSLLCFLVDLATLLKCPFPLPPNVLIAIIQKQVIDGTEKTRTTVHKLTQDIPTVEDSVVASDATPAVAMDAFDVLVDSPQKFKELSELLLGFVNMHLAMVNIQANDLSMLDDGVHAIILIGILANLFVPLSKYHLIPSTEAHKVHNVKFGLELTKGLGIDTNRIEPQDIIQGNTTTICRWIFVLYANEQNSGSVVQ
ncbi:hypothetical protein BDV3_006908 [Batrachochytrium dendrobatidis]